MQMLMQWKRIGWAILGKINPDTFLCPLLRYLPIEYFLAIFLCLFSLYDNDMLTQYRPIHSHMKGNDSEIKEETRHKKADCMKIFLEAGADMSIEVEDGAFGHNTFVDAVESGSVVTTVVLTKM